MIRHGPHVRRHEPIRLPRWQEWSVYLSFGLMLVSGVLWLLFHYFVQVESEYGPRPHPLEYQWLRLHGASAMLGLIALGSVLPVHIRRAWELGKNRVTGLFMLGCLAALAATGYMLYYFAGGDSRAAVSMIHWGLGLTLVPGLAWHVWTGRLRAQHRALAQAAAAADGASAQMTPESSLSASR